MSHECSFWVLGFDKWPKSGLETVYSHAKNVGGLLVPKKKKGKKEEVGTKNSEIWTDVSFTLILEHMSR